jgi:glycosyltransferase involved in cell wall biosynthesis
MILSACLIVRNEERFLDRCLSSLAGFADQICVLDTGSSDGTMDIARRHGAVLGRIEWDDDFSAARNACLDLAHGDWILQIDADEELRPVDPARRSRILSSRAPCQLVELELRGDGGRSERTWQPRLFRRDLGLRYRRALHETILDDLAERALPPPQPCELLLVHHGYVGEVVSARDKIERNRRILRKVRDKGLADAYDLFKLASALDVGQDPSLLGERSATWRSCLASGWSAPRSIRSEWPWWPRAARAAAWHLWFHEGRLGESLEALEALHADDPSDRETLRALAAMEVRAGTPGRAHARLDPSRQDEFRLHVLGMEASGDRSGALRTIVGDTPGAKALKARLLVAQGRIREGVALLESCFPDLLTDAVAGLDAATALDAIGESALARNLLSRPLDCPGDIHLERQALAGAPMDRTGDTAPRDRREAARAILEGALAGRAPTSLDRGFHLPSVRDALADLLDAALVRGDEALVRRFAASSAAWDGVLPGASRLVEGV